MKYIKLLTVFSLVILLNACDKNNNNIFESIGTIIGPDLSMSVCAGGYIFDLEEDDEIYRIEDVPATSDIDLENSTFPITIRLNWTLDRTCGTYKYILIDDLEQVE